MRVLKGAVAQVDRQFADEGTTCATPAKSFFSDPAECRRCGGFLVPEQLAGLEYSFMEHLARAFRCIQCGDVIDPVIVSNRISAGVR